MQILQLNFDVTHDFGIPFPTVMIDHSDTVKYPLIFL